ncbi:hypothetical protein P175DRAFT_0344307 [Aspergillus ochraceoroseus IBT 24754]|uniref:Uncharacterized protein n=1 Tax=Aspergillus ochraceoroseus IBT 24754 TaxID=1392256 RepID=A0A2T5LNX8_9EURO|nr:uncharacterized protein P175DRAFT_0344307 [Aspergillus ochraceoroseus IBT 24754]PTU17984.1 hypothetical protein P175DRAFT_0344307 [Aspergillus ochraceoroseus IBT 24754]
MVISQRWCNSQALWSWDSVISSGCAYNTLYSTFYFGSSDGWGYHCEHVGWPKIFFFPETKWHRHHRHPSDVTHDEEQSKTSGTRSDQEKPIEATLYENVAAERGDNSTSWVGNGKCYLVGIDLVRYIYTDC